MVICGHNKKMSDSLLKKLPSTDKFKVAIKGSFRECLYVCMYCMYICVYVCVYVTICLCTISTDLDHDLKCMYVQMNVRIAMLLPI